MKSHFEILKATRANLVKTTAELSEEQWNLIPAGFNNNIAWNLAHVLVTQQLLCYKLAKVEPLVSGEMIDKFKKGSKPDGTIMKLPEIEQVKSMLFSSIDQLVEDYNGGKLKNFDYYPTSFGFPLSNIEDAITFNNAHEAMHFGNILSMKKLV